MPDAGGWWQPISAYCERTDPGFWAEPVNAVSNIGFLLAGLAGARQAARDGPDAPALCLSAVVVVVGIGSFLFHTLAVRWSLLADVIPIAVFIYAYFLLAMRRFLGLAAGTGLLATLGFAAASFGLAPALALIVGPAVMAATNESADYLPALTALWGVAALLAAGCGPLPGPDRRAAAASLARSGAIFAVSLAARTIDRSVCGTVPIGSHAIWHLLNAWMLYRLVALAVRVRAGRLAEAAPR